MPRNACLYDCILYMAWLVDIKGEFIYKKKESNSTEAGNEKHIEDWFF